MPGFDPLLLSGRDFLALYALLLVGAVAMGWVLPRWLRPDGKVLVLQHPFELACLSGGPTRYAETLVVGLMQAGHLAVREDRSFVPLHPVAGQSSAEVTVLGLPPGTDWDMLMCSLWNAANWVELRLIARGLWVSRAEWWEIRGWSCLPYGLVLVFGAIRWEVGLLHQQPVPYLGSLLLVTLLAGIVRCVTIDRRTCAGAKVLEAARKEAEDLRHDRRLNQASMAVALFGTSVLAGTPYEALYRLRLGRKRPVATVLSRA